MSEPDEDEDEEEEDEDLSPEEKGRVCKTIRKLSANEGCTFFFGYIRLCRSCTAFDKSVGSLVARYFDLIFFQRFEKNSK